MNNGHMIQMPVPILGLHTYTCKQAHTYQAQQAFRMPIPLGPPVNGQQQVVASPPLCPWCFLEAMGFKYPSWPEGKTLEEAVRDGDLNDACMEVSDG